MSTPIQPISRDELLAALRDLPPLPSVVLELVESLGHEELSATQYAAKISRDQALAAKILRLANSSFYGRGRQVRSVPEAITLLGLRTVRGAVTAAGLAGSFRRHPEASTRPLSGATRSAVPCVPRHWPVNCGATTRMSRSRSGCCTTSAGWRWPTRLRRPMPKSSDGGMTGIAPLVMPSTPCSVSITPRSAG